MLEENKDFQWMSISSTRIFDTSFVEIHWKWHRFVHFIAKDLISIMVDTKGYTFCTHGIEQLILYRP